METVEITLLHYYATNSIDCEQESGLRVNAAYKSTRRLTDSYHIFRICASLLQLFPHVQPSSLRLVETLSSLVPDDVSATGILRRRSYSVEQLAVRHSNCFFCHNFQESTQDSFIYPVILHNIISSVRLYGALAVTLWTCYGAL